jgi:hypothetical protein
MAQVVQSVTRKIRFPVEVLAALDGWAEINRLSRSQAVRRLVLRSLTTWEDDAEGWCTCEGGTGACPVDCQPLSEAAE